MPAQRHRTSSGNSSCLNGSKERSDSGMGFTQVLRSCPARWMPASLANPRRSAYSLSVQDPQSFLEASLLSCGVPSDSGLHILPGLPLLCQQQHLSSTNSSTTADPRSPEKHRTLGQIPQYGEAFSLWPSLWLIKSAARSAVVAIIFSERPEGTPPSHAHPTR